MIARAARSAAAIALIGVGLVTTTRAAAQDPVDAPILDAPVVTVNRTGGVSASGTVDCSEYVLEQWGNYESAPDAVLTNVDWTVVQPQGRRIITATFEDHQASPCWAKSSFPFLDPGRCTLADDGTLHPCVWDTYNYGSDGWVYGDGAFKPGAVHLSATMNGGWYDSTNLEWYATGGWTVRAVRR